MAKQFFPELAQPILGGIDAAAGLTTGIIGAVQRKKEREQAQRQFEETMKWQKEENEIMRQREDTAIQRQQADLAAAGINPMMAGNLGGASAAAGGVTSMYTPPSAALDPSIGQVFSSLAKTDWLGLSRAKDEYSEWLKDKDIRKADREIAQETLKEVKARVGLFEQEAAALGSIKDQKGQNYYKQKFENELSEMTAQINNLQTANIDKKAIAAAALGASEIILPLASSFLKKEDYDALVDSLESKAGYIFGQKDYKVSDLAKKLKAGYKASPSANSESDPSIINLLWQMLKLIMSGKAKLM